jgi:hypothetical protein
MNIKQHTLQTGEMVLLVPVPSDAIRFEIFELKKEQYLLHADVHDITIRKIKIPKGNWQLIGISEELTDEQAKDMGFISLESFQSLLQSLGCEGRHAVLLGH